MGSSPTVLVTGAGGQVGRALEPLVTDAIFLPRASLDVTDERAVLEAIADVDVVVHLAAMTDVDGCETDAERAERINVQGTANVVKAASASGRPTRVIYLSTDYVFDGTLDSAYTESHEPDPINVYGRTKLGGERAVLMHPENLVVRSSTIFGDGPNFVRAVIARARQEHPIGVVADQVSRPTFASDLARALSALITDAGTTGILNVAGGGEPCSRADLAEAALGYAGLSVSIERVDSQTYEARAGKALAPRPLNSVLDTSTAIASGLELRDWRLAVREYVESTS